MLHNRRSLMAMFGAALATPLAVTAAAQVGPEWKGLVWSPECALYVAIGHGGDIATSENGRDWKLHVNEDGHNVLWTEDSDYINLTKTAETIQAAIREI